METNVKKLLTSADHAKIEQLIAFAKAHKIEVDEMIEIALCKRPPVGDREGFAIELDARFKLVFSIEHHPQSRGGAVWIKHMSVSQAQPSDFPAIGVIQTICQALSFPDMAECAKYLEQNCKAINVMALYNDDDVGDVK